MGEHGEPHGDEKHYTVDIECDNSSMQTVVWHAFFRLGIRRCTSV